MAGEGDFPRAHHGFVFDSIRLIEKATRFFLEIEIRPRKGNRPLCSVCGNPGRDLPDSGRSVDCFSPPHLYSLCYFRGRGSS